MKLVYPDIVIALLVGLSLWAVIWLIFGWQIVLGLVGALLLCMLVAAAPRGKPK